MPVAFDEADDDFDVLVVPGIIATTLGIGHAVTLSFLREPEVIDLTVAPVRDSDLTASDRVC